MPSPGTAPGIETDSLGPTLRPQPVRIVTVDYCLEQVRSAEITNLVEFLAHHRPSWSHVRWINVEGYGQPEVIRALAEKYQIHPLAIEDVLSNVHRPKAEGYAGSDEQPGRLFVIARAVSLVDGELTTEQVSFFLGRTTLLTFQEKLGDDFAPVRPRIDAKGSRLRENDVSFLFYALLDQIVDGYFPVLEHYSDRLEALEEEMLINPDREAWKKVHIIKRELLVLRHAAWPMREMISQLLRERHECLSETTRTYFRDVYDHCVHILDMIETYREVTTALVETYMSAISNRMNEIMKVLTTISTIFIPLSFLAGVYGMNLDFPEKQWFGAYAYPLFWGICLSVIVGMLVWLRWRKWL